MECGDDATGVKMEERLGCNCLISLTHSHNGMQLSESIVMWKNEIMIRFTGDRNGLIKKSCIFINWKVPARKLHLKTCLGYIAHGQHVGSLLLCLCEVFER